MEDETFYVVESAMIVRVGEEQFTVGPGRYVFGPRGIPHGFRNAGATPAGCERFVRDLTVPVGSGVPHSVPPDMGQLIAVATEYRIEILGPFPE